jgi:hypothetical protein
MYELNRARLVGIGPRGARYSDVTLDLSGLGDAVHARDLIHSPERRPSPCSLLLLENGGGKSVLLKLLFSVVLPGRRSTVGGAALEKFVLDTDTGHVALEWMHVVTGELLVAAKVFQRRSKSAANSNSLNEAWYSFRPTDELDLSSLPVSTDGRRRRLEGFREVLAEYDRRLPATQLAWIGDEQARWKKHLRERGIEPDLFDIQRRMNVDEGEAAKAFKYTSSKDFVNWLLTTVTDPEDATSVAETFRQWATNLADRQDMLLERDFLEGVIAGLDPLAEAHQADVEAARARESAIVDGQHLVGTLRARQLREEKQAEGIRTEQGVVRGLVVSRETERDSSRALLNEVRRQTLLLELAHEQQQKADLDEQLGDVELELAGWETLPAVAERDQAVSTANRLADQVSAADKDAAPALTRRDVTASWLLAKYDAAAAAADAEMQQNLDDAEAARIDAGEAEQERGDALSLAAEVRERHRAHEAVIANAEARIEAASEIGLLPLQTRPVELPGIVNEAIDAHRRSAEDVGEARNAAEELKAAVSGAESSARGAEQTAQEAADDAARAQRDLEVVFKSAGRVGAMPAIVAAMGTSDDQNPIADVLVAEQLENAAEHLLAVLGSDIAAHTEALDGLRVTQREDARIVEALGDGGLLPARAAVQQALAILESADVVAHDGWRYLREAAPAAERADLIAAHPELADGIVVTDHNQLNRAHDALIAANLMPAAAVAVGAGAALLALPVVAAGADAEVLETAAFVIDPTPAMYDEAAAAIRRDEIHAAMTARSMVMGTIGDQLDQTVTGRGELSQWRRDNPAGRLAHLHDRSERLAEAAAAARSAADDLANKLADLRGRYEQAVGLVDAAVTRERERSDRLQALRALAEYTAAATVAEGKLDALISDIARHNREADQAARRGKEAHASAREYGKLAEQKRAAAERHRSAAADVPSTSGWRSAEVPAESLAALKDEAAAAHRIYLAMATDPDLRRQAEEAASKVGQIQIQFNLRDKRHVTKAEELRATSAGTDSASWAVAAANARDRRNRLQADHTEASRRTGQLEASVRSASPTEPGRRSWTSLSPEWRPASVVEGQALQIAAQDELRSAQTRLEAVNGRAAQLVIRFDETEKGAQIIREALIPVVTLLGDRAPDEPAVDIYQDPVETAAPASARVFERLRSTSREADDRRSELTNAIRELTSFANQNRYETLANQARRSILDSPPERLAAQAADWAVSLTARLATLTSDLANVNRHRKAIVERLAALVDHALRALRQAARLSRLPADLAEWSGRPFLRIAFAEPDPSAVSVHVGEVVDRTAAEFATRAGAARAKSSKRDGMSLLLEAVNASVPKGFAVDVLKPDSVLRDERVSIEEMNEVFSGGQELTAAIVLYCTLAALRANERGQMRARHSGVLFLDNPIGRANASYLLDLQQSVAKALGVQLIYTTGITDDRVLAAFPLWIRLRNDADLRAGLKHIQVADVVRRVLPPPYEDGDQLPGDRSDPGTVTAGRVYRRSAAQDALEDSE